MPFGMGPAGWAYMTPYVYLYAGLPYPMWPWYAYWHPWRWMVRYWGMTPYTWPWAPLPKDQETAMLEEQARILETELDGIKKRLEELKK